MITGRAGSFVWLAVFFVRAGANCVPHLQAHFSIAVFPASIQGGLYGGDGVTIPDWVLWASLPLPATVVAWVCASGVATQERRARHQRQSVIK